MTRNEPATMPVQADGDLLDNILVYEWQAWEGWLISHLVDSSCRVTAHYKDPADVLSDRLDRSIDAVLLHIDVTHSAAFPKRRAKIVEHCRRRGLPVLNAGIGDISKRNLHRILDAAGLPSAAAKRRGDPNEWLFVKSNLNWGGEVEHRFKVTRKKKFGVGTEPSPISSANDYYKAQRQSIDPELWSDKRVVIERYIGNDEASFHRVYCFGDAVVVVKGHCGGAIKKLCGHPDDLNYAYSTDAIVRRETELPTMLNETLRRFLLGTEIEFFCLDIMHDSNDYYIVDLNLTPYSGTGEQNAEMVTHMQEGIGSYLRHAGPGPRARSRARAR